VLDMICQNCNVNFSSVESEKTGVCPTCGSTDITFSSYQEEKEYEENGEARMNGYEVD